MPLVLGPVVPLEDVPVGLRAHAAMQVRTVEGQPRPRRDRQGRPRYDQVWLVTADPAIELVEAALTRVSPRDLAWLTDAHRRSASVALRRIERGDLDELARAGAVRLLCQLGPDHASVGQLVRVEPEPDAQPALDAWRTGLARDRDADLERVRQSWGVHGDPELLMDRLAGLPAAERHIAADMLVSLASALPANMTPLSQLATDLTDDSHALDSGTTLGGIAVAGAAIVAGQPPPTTALERRVAWEGAGVAMDPWSSHVVGWHLPLDPDHPAGAVAMTHDRHGQAAILSLAVLRAADLSARPPAGASETVWVVENAATLATLVTQRVRAPVVWRAGNPSAAVQVLLRALARAGWRIAVGADFEPVGLRGARTLLDMLGTAGTPWRLSADDYDPSLATDQFAGDPPATPWDPKLQDLLRRHRSRVLEEHRVDVLLADVKGSEQTERTAP